MKTHFITYGSNAFEESARKIVEDAKALGIFKEFRRYTPEDLPLPIKSSPLFLSGKGGGHWLWKPYIIHNYLQKIPAGDTVVYADCGSTIFPSDKWQNYFMELEGSHAVFFQYRDGSNYGWKAFNPKFSDSPKLKFWLKNSAKEHFSKIFENEAQWLEKNKLWAGFMILKNDPETRQIIGDWLNSMLYEPQFANDLLLSEREEQSPNFAENRYDQTILTITARYYETKGWVKILDEEAENEYPDQAIRATRKKVGVRNSILKKIVKKIRRK